MQSTTTDQIRCAPACGAVAVEANDRGAIEQAPIKVRVTYLLAVLLPFIGVIAAGVLLWPFGFSWLYLAMLLVMYLLTGLGVTIGYHRLFTHKSFKTNRVVTFILGALGSMAVEGPILEWVATHRCHHQHSDEEGDPHSPNTHGRHFGGMIKGLWHAHMGWMFRAPMPDLHRYVPDLEKDRLVRVMSRFFPFWILIGLMIPTALGGLITMSWTGALLGFIWGGLVRVFLVHHVTWSVNSVCHIWGSKPFESHDESRNNLICGIFAFGEGWHNNHHVFPTSARHGLKWWQFDLSYLIIRGMELLGLASDVKVPSAERIEAKRRVAA